MPATYRIEFMYNTGGVPMQTHFDFATPAPDATYSECLELLTAFASSAAASAMLDCLSDDSKLTGITCRSIIADGGSSTATPTAVIIGAGDPGTRTGDIGSNQDTAVLSMVPAIMPGERPRVNKMFIGPLNKADQVVNTVSAGMLTAIAALKAACLAGFSVTSGAVNWIAIIKVLGVHVARAIVSSGAEDFIASQNRRRPDHV